MFSERAKQKEILDLGPAHYTQEEYFDCLKKLERVGAWLGGDAATFKALANMTPPPASILDVGCGGGAFAIAMAKRYPEAAVVGIEIDPLAIFYAQKNLAAAIGSPDNVRFELRNAPELCEPPKSYDVITSTLVCHHLDDDALVDFLKRAIIAAKRKVIINDLHRHPAAYGAFRTLCPLAFRNRLVLHDGPLSIRRGFQRNEWEKYLQQAGISEKKYRIAWRWAFRYVIEIDVE